MEKMEIQHLSEEDQLKFKEGHDQAEPKEWALIDRESEVVMEFYDSEGDAKAALEEWRQRDLVENALREAVYKIADEVGIDVAKVTEFAKEFF